MGWNEVLTKDDQYLKICQKIFMYFNHSFSKIKDETANELQIIRVNLQVYLKKIFMVFSLTEKVKNLGLPFRKLY